MSYVRPTFLVVVLGLVMSMAAALPAQAVTPMPGLVVPFTVWEVRLPIAS